MHAERAGTGAAGGRAIRVAVVGDVRLYREGLIASLARFEGIVIVGSARGLDGLDAALAERPDIVVLDMATGRSLDIVRAVRAAAPSARTIAFAVEEVDREILACIEAGIAGYVRCDGSLADLVGTIESVMRGELLCSPQIAATLLRRVAALAPQAGAAAAAAGHASDVATAPLTGREREIAALLHRGLSNKEIARQLHIEVATVKNHVHNILAKLQVDTRGQAAAQLREPAPAPSPAASRAARGELAGPVSSSSSSSSSS